MAPYVESRWFRHVIEEVYLVKDTWKRVAAVLGIIVLLAAVSLPMVFAFGSGEGAAGRFRASLGAAILVPVMAYVIWMVYRILSGSRNKEPEGEIRNIVFDVGNVLVTYDWETYLRSFGFPEEEYRAIADAVFRSDVWNERDRGLRTEEEYVADFIAGAPQYEADILRVMQDVRKVILPRDYAPVWTRLLKERGYHLYILSNYCQSTLEETKPLMKFLKDMDGVIFSCEEKQIKPEPPIYQTLLTRYQLDPARCVFIDDREENCEAARRAGMKAIRFESFSQTTHDLENLGVKVIMPAGFQE